MILLLFAVLINFSISLPHRPLSFPLTLSIYPSTSLSPVLSLSISLSPLLLLHSLTHTHSFHSLSHTHTSYLPYFHLSAYLESDEAADQINSYLYLTYLSLTHSPFLSISLPPSLPLSLYSLFSLFRV